MDTFTSGFSCRSGGFGQEGEMKKYLIVDIVMLLIYLVAATPAITGVAAHEWLGVGLIVVFLVHTVMHYDWIVDTLRGKKDKQKNTQVLKNESGGDGKVVEVSTSGEATKQNSSFARKGNLILDVVILIVFMVVSVSGMGISGAVLPTFGLYADGYYFWNPLHSISAKVLLALLVLHIALHWRWVFAALKNQKSATGE